MTEILLDEGELSRAASEAANSPETDFARRTAPGAFRACVAPDVCYLFSIRARGADCVLYLLNPPAEGSDFPAGFAPAASRVLSDCLCPGQPSRPGASASAPARPPAPAPAPTPKPRLRPGSTPVLRPAGVPRASLEIRPVLEGEDAKGDELVDPIGHHWVTSRAPIVTTDDVERVEVTPDTRPELHGVYTVTLFLSPAGAERLRGWTTTRGKGQLAILVDGELFAVNGFFYPLDASAVLGARLSFAEAQAFAERLAP